MKRMSIHKNADGQYSLNGMNDDDLRSLLMMINSACLEERRVWNGIKLEIIKILQQ